MNRTYTIYDTRLKITGLLEGSEYQFRVTAVNKAGDSQPSDASAYILCKDPTCERLLPSDWTLNLLKVDSPSSPLSTSRHPSSSLRASHH